MKTEISGLKFDLSICLTDFPTNYSLRKFGLKTGLTHMSHHMHACDGQRKASRLGSELISS